MGARIHLFERGVYDGIGLISENCCWIERRACTSGHGQRRGSDEKSPPIAFRRFIRERLEIEVVEDRSANRNQEQLMHRLYHAFDGGGEHVEAGVAAGDRGSAL